MLFRGQLRTLCPLLALVSGCAAGAARHEACRSDEDCEDGQTCRTESGSCVSEQDAAPVGDGGEDGGDGDDASGGLCDSCLTATDCAADGALCLPTAAGRFCGRPCSDDEPCPNEYACTEVVDEAGRPVGTQCTPQGGDCTCLPHDEGKVRSCTVSSEDGNCEGIQRCYAATGWGPCQAPEPGPETCDGLDNDCDGQIDEDLVLGTCGLGVCTAPEICEPNPDGARLVCDSGPQTSITDSLCNVLDDDCDGSVDEDYVPFTCGDGVCIRDSICDAQGREICIEGDRTLDSDNTCNATDEDCDGSEDEDYVPTSCGLGICVSDSSCQGGQVFCEPGPPDPDDAPELLFEDSNCDGLDGDAMQAVFVDLLTGDDGNPGTIDAPLRSIQAGIDTAELLGQDVYVSEGTYEESLLLADGVSLYGGYSAANGWSRSVANIVEISGGTVAVRGTQIDEPTEIQLLTIRSADNVASGASSYALFLSGSEGVTLRHVTLRAGSGGSGIGGSPGVDGANGTDGLDGQPGCEDSSGLCDTCNRPSGGGGGTSTCGRDGGDGGWPGHECSCGSAGGGGVGGTLGGLGGCGCGGGNGEPGEDGDDGVDGINGARGAAFGTAGAGSYSASNGTSGTSGTYGEGGGGGGGGSGGDSYCDSYGSSGGGGGGGGCAGTRGTRGTGGGGSFGIYLWDSSLSLYGCSIYTAAGGAGGVGGTAGSAGEGGGPGAGGPYGGGGEQDDGGNGAAGGRGGNGGRGGHGGGGGGGPSIGIECAGVSDLAANEDPDYSLGTGGTGGQSAGNDGLTGRVAETDGC